MINGLRLRIKNLNDMTLIKDNGHFKNLWVKITEV